MTERSNNKIDGTQEKVARIGMWQAIIVAVITTIGGGLIGYFTGQSGPKKDIDATRHTFSPYQDAQIVNELPKNTNSDDYQQLKNFSIFDLRNWRFTPDSLLNKRYSPANFTNYLLLKKLKKINSIIIHFATTGYAIDMRCITNRFNFFQKRKANIHDNKTVKEYALEIDVRNIPIGKEFLIILDATYWNGFNNMTTEDASTYTTDQVTGLDDLGIIVFFPDSKPFKEYKRLEKDNSSEIVEDYRDNSMFYADKSNKYIYWVIHDCIPEHHYTLKWEW